MGLRNFYNGVKGFVRNPRVLASSLLLASIAGTGYILHDGFKDITKKVGSYSQVYKESGKTSLEHDVECADSRGRLIDINKSWKKPDEVDYVLVRLEKDKVYVCRAANPHANPEERVIWTKFMQLIDANKKEYRYTLSGYQSNPNTGEVRFSFSDYGKYRVQLGVSTYDPRGRKWQTPEMKTLEFVVLRPQEKIPKANSTKKNGGNGKSNSKQPGTPAAKTPQPDAQVKEQESSEGYDLPDIDI